MQRFISKLGEPFHDFRSRIKRTRSHTPTTDEHSGTSDSRNVDPNPTIDERIDQSDPRNAEQHPAVDERFDESILQDAQSRTPDEETPKKLSAREILDGLSSFRIQPDALNIASADAKTGGKAEVVQATFGRGDATEEQVVAVKKLHYHYLPGMRPTKFDNAFVHEVEVMAGLSHENIVRLIGFVEDLENGKAWIVLPWEPNGNLREFLATGGWEVPERVSLIKDTFEGIKYLHTRQPPICHGDLKSLNILVNSSYRAIVTDFGSARAIDEPAGEMANEGPVRDGERRPTDEGACPPIHVGAVGNQLTLTGPAWSLRWAAPEVVDGQRPGLASDIWAAAWVCWEAMTNKVPFPEVNSKYQIMAMVIQGEIPSAREDEQLGQIIALCSLMKDCWAFDAKTRPGISQCCSKIQWMPSIRPSRERTSTSEASSVMLLEEMAQMFYKQDQYEKAISLLQQALSLAEAANDQRQSASALHRLGNVYRSQSKHDKAEACYTQAQTIYARIGDDWGQADALRGLGHLYRLQSKFAKAEACYMQAQKIYAPIGDSVSQANTLRGLGHLYRKQSKYTEAEACYIEAQKIYARIGNDVGQVNTLQGLGHLYRSQSKYTEAEACYTQAQETYARIGNQLGRANTMRGLGHLCREQGRNAEAATHYAEARDLYARLGNRMHEEDAARWLAQCQRSNAES